MFHEGSKYFELNIIFSKVYVNFSCPLKNSLSQNGFPDQIKSGLPNRCLKISYIRIPAETDKFKLSTWPFIGIFTR